ncbi:MAG TPA: hypothetical protein VMH27_09725 [Puia sp.]|nr:hypothetical protein [Puia sp.]
MAKAKKEPKRKPKGIEISEENIRVEPGQLTFLPALKKVIKTKEQVQTTQAI